MDSRTETPMKDAISLKVMIVSMKGIRASLVIVLMRRENGLIMSAFIKR